MSKRITSLLLIAVMLLCLAACGNEAEEPSAPADDIGDIASTVAPTSTPTPEPEETVEPGPSATPEASPRLLSRRRRRPPCPYA